MAIMATEQPKTLPVDQKPKGSAEAQDMAVDESAAPAVNGHAKSDEKSTEELVDATAVNGKAQSPSPSSAVPTNDAQNQQAFAANNSLPEQTPSESTAKPEAAGDVEMPDANGSLVDEKKEPTPVETTETADVAQDKDNAKTEKDNTEKPIQEESQAETPATAKDQPAAETDKDITESKPAPEPSVPSADDKMDVDASNEAPAPSSGTEQEQADKSQDTSTPNAVPSKNADEQPADESKSSPAAKDESKPESDVPREERAVSPTKVSRVREDDNLDEPASKRPKIGDTATPVGDSLVVASGPSPAPQDPSKSSDDTVPDDKPITTYQSKLLRSTLASLKKTKNGGHFRNSVEKLWPLVWTDYQAKVKDPVDLTMFEGMLREEKFANYGELKAKVRLLYTNSATFNGPDHFITGAGAVVRDQILARIQEVAKQDEPAKPEKGKAQPTRHAEPRSVVQARRQSQPQAAQAAASPKPKADPVVSAGATSANSSSAPVFAIPPNGIPQIRRDSTQKDGDRPKRPIHPPKSRDLDYGSKANRKKKLDPEQRFHDEVMNEVKKGKYFHMNQWFMEPVDPVALNIPTYFSIVKKPMDLGTMTRKNLEGDYKSSKDIEKDMRLIVHNAELFNGKDHDVARLGKELEELFKAELQKKDQWMAQHYPQDEPSAANASAASPERSLHESDEESEAEGGEDTSEAIRNLQVRLNEEQDKLNTLLGSKKPDLTMIEIQQQMVSMLQRKLVEERTKFHSDAKKPKSKKKSAKPKPKPGANAAAGANKKNSVSNASTSKKGSGGSKKPTAKKRAIGSLEKAVIEEGIGNLDGNTLTKAVEIIKRDTGQNENDEGEMELDIESLTQEALAKLYDLIHKAHPGIRTALEKRPEYSSQAAPSEPEPKIRSTGPPKPKKNKPMNKVEQEQKIEQLRSPKAQLARQGSGSQEPPPVGAGTQAAETSEEDSDSEEE